MMSDGLRERSPHTWVLGRRLLPLGLACILGLVIGYLAWASGQGSQTHVPDPTAPTDEPLLGGERTTLAEATATAGFLLPRPQSSWASDASISEVWIARDAGAVAIVYDSGVRAYVTPWPLTNPLTPGDFYRELAAGSSSGRTGQINGYVAWIAPANGQVPGLLPETIIDFVIDGVEVSLRGGQLSVDELIQVAESVRSVAA